MAKSSFVHLLTIQALLFSSSLTAIAQNGAPTPQQPKQPSFEVATIKLAAPSPDGRTHINYPPNDDRFSAINITLSNLMQWAYNLPEKQILDGPPWLTSIRFDIQAKASPDTEKSAAGQNQEIKRAMVRSLIEDRFNLKSHSETRVLPAYNLVQVHSGSKLKVSKSDGKSVSSTHSSFTGQGLTTPMIAEVLAQITGRIVVDKTNLTDRYDLKLAWTPDDAATTDNSLPSLLTAIQEQLGLKLEASKEPVPVLVIDHIEKPAEN